MKCKFTRSKKYFEKYDENGKPICKTYNICNLTRNSSNNGTECNGNIKDRKNCPFWSNKIQ